MATPRIASEAEAAENRKKLEYLRANGYPYIKVDGSWGQHQDKIWRELMNRQLPKPTISNKSLTVALPLLVAAGTSGFLPIAIVSGLGYGLTSPEVRETADLTYNLGKAFVLNVGNLIGGWFNPASSTASGNTLSGTSLSRRGRRKPAALPASGGTAAGNTSSTAAPSPNPLNDNDTTKVAWYRKPWETAKNSPLASRFGRTARNFGIRVPVYSGAAAPVLDVTGNVIGASREDDNVVHQWAFPLTETRFGFERGLYKLIGDLYTTKVSYDPSYLETDASIENLLPTDTFTRAPMAVPDTARIHNGIVFVSL